MPVRGEIILGDLVFPECPRWHDDQLWFSDFYAHTVVTVDRGGNRADVLRVAGQPAGLGWRRDGTLIVASMTDHLLLGCQPPDTTVLTDLSGVAAGPLNDLIVDEQDRTYVGSFGFDLFAKEPAAPTSLLRVDPDGSVRAVAEELWFPNGMTFTPGGLELLVAETLANRLSAFSVNSDGDLGPRRDWAQLSSLGAMPDGIALDRDGCVWVADAAGHRLLRVAEGGTVQDVVETGSLNAFACCLGGSDGRTLFACVAPSSSPRRAVSEKSGQILAFEVAVPGAAW